MNYKLITHLLSEVSRVFEAARLSQKQVILVLGNTGSGKSTLIDHLLGHLLKSEYDENTGIGHVVLDDIKNLMPSDYAKIGQKGSETTIPQIFTLDSGELIVDMPGFSDTRSIEFDIVLYLSIQMLINSGTRIKNIIVLMTEEELLVSRGKEFWGLANTLSHMVNPEIMCEFWHHNVIFGVTKCSGRRTEHQLKEKLKRLYEDKRTDLSGQVISYNDLKILDLMEVMGSGRNLMKVDIFDEGEGRKAIFEFIARSVAKNKAYFHHSHAFVYHKDFLVCTTGIAAEYIDLLDHQKKFVQEASDLSRKLTDNGSEKMTSQMPRSVELSKIIIPTLEMELKDLNARLERCCRRHEAEKLISPLGLELFKSIGHYDDPLEEISRIEAQIKEKKKYLSSAKENFVTFSRWENILMGLNEQINGIEEELNKTEKVEKFEFLHAIAEIVPFSEGMIEGVFVREYSTRRLDFVAGEAQAFGGTFKMPLRFSEVPDNQITDLQSMSVNMNINDRVAANQRLRMN